MFAIFENHRFSEKTGLCIEARQYSSNMIVVFGSLDSLKLLKRYIGNFKKQLALICLYFPL